MSSSWRLRIREPGRPPVESPLRDGLVLGRGDEADLRVADPYVSGQQVRIVAERGRFLVEDLGGANPTQVDEGPVLERGERHPLSSGAVFIIGKTLVEVIGPDSPGERDVRSGNRGGTLAIEETAGDLRTLRRGVHAGLDTRKLLTAALELPARLNAAATESAVFDVACQYAVKALPGILREAYVVVAPRERGGNAEILAKHIDPGRKASDERERTTLSRRVLERVAAEPDSFVLFTRAVEGTINATVPRDIQAVGACLIDRTRDRRPILIYALGDQAFIDGQRLVAAYLGVVATLVRHQILLLRRARLGKYFSPAVIGLMMKRGGLEEAEGAPRVVDATSFFFDLRGFSFSSEAAARDLGTVHKDLQEVLSTVTDEVFACGGTVVDYYGDGMFAAWGAPFEQPDQSDRAGRCALRILRRLQKDDIGILRRGQSRGHAPCGIGIDRGEVLAGSVGSREQFKYGLLGNSVNTASRLEGLTRPDKLHAPVLMTAAARAGITDPGLRTRRIGKVLASGMRNAIEVYELCLDTEPDQGDRAAREEVWRNALALLEGARTPADLDELRRAARGLGDDDPRRVWFDPLLSELRRPGKLDAWDGVLRF